MPALIRACELVVSVRMLPSASQRRTPKTHPPESIGGPGRRHVRGGRGMGALAVGLIVLLGREAKGVNRVMYEAGSIAVSRWPSVGSLSPREDDTIAGPTAARAPPPAGGGRAGSFHRGGAAGVGGSVGRGRVGWARLITGPDTSGTPRRGPIARLEHEGARRIRRAGRVRRVEPGGIGRDGVGWDRIEARLLSQEQGGEAKRVSARRAEDFSEVGWGGAGGEVGPDLAAAARQFEFALGIATPSTSDCRGLRVP